MSVAAVLIGLPGSGKTTTGRRLARILHVRFADSDELLQAGAGATVAEIFAAHGEPHFRRLEAQTIATALTDFDGVLCLGGGAVLDAGTRGRLAAGSAPVVLLRARVDTLLARVGDATSRPLLAGGAQARLEQLARERGSVYDDVATVTVDTDSRTPGQVASMIAARIHSRSVRT